MQKANPERRKDHGYREDLDKVLDTLRTSYSRRVSPLATRLRLSEAKCRELKQEIGRQTGRS